MEPCPQVTYSLANTSSSNKWRTNQYIITWQHDVLIQENGRVNGIGEYKMLPGSIKNPFKVVLSRFSRARLFVALWTVVCQAPLSKGTSWQEYWSGMPCPPPGDLPDPGMEPISLYVSYTGRQVLYHSAWEALIQVSIHVFKMRRVRMVTIF